MRWNPARFAMMVMFAGMAACATHRTVYEARGDAWGPGETTYYSRWEVETHRPHVEWETRNDDDHHAYWEWRHSHHD
jgi:hypothetical protein